MSVTDTPLNIISTLTVLTGGGFCPVKANWLQDGGIEHVREDRNTAITHKRGREGYLVMFDGIYPTAPGVHLNGRSPLTLTESCNQLSRSGV